MAGTKSKVQVKARVRARALSTQGFGVHLSQAILSSKFLLGLLIAINVAGAVYGFYFYQPEFSINAPALWIFVPDSPMYVFLFAAVLFFFAAVHRLPKFWTELAFAGLLKIGFWTVLTILLYREYFLAPSVISWYGALGILHIGMILEAFVLLSRLKPKKWHAGAILLWFIIGDILDYVFGTMPRPDVITTSTAKMNFLFVESVAASVFLGAWLFERAKRARKPGMAWQQKKL